MWGTQLKLSRITCCAVLTFALVFIAVGHALAKYVLEKPSLPRGAALNLPFDMQSSVYQPNSRENYFQTWNAYWKTDQGFHVFANFVISNLGMGDNNCGLNIAITKPDGTSQIETVQLKGEHFTGHTDRFFVQCGAAKWLGNAGSMQISAQLNRLAIEMVVERRAPGFGPPTLFLEPAHEDFLLYNMPHINSAARGKVRIDNEWHTLSGAAIVEHLAQNVPLYAYSRVWHRIRILDGDRSLVIGGFEPSQDLEEGYTLLVLTQGDQIVHATDQAYLKPTAFHKDPSSGYDVPSAFTLTVDDPNLRLSFTIERVRPINKIDVLQELNWFLRVIVRTFFTNPWLFRQEVQIDGTYTSAGVSHTLDVQAMQEVIFVND